MSQSDQTPQSPQPPKTDKLISIVLAFIGCAGFWTVVQTVIQHYFPSQPISVTGTSPPTPTTTPQPTQANSQPISVTGTSPPTPTTTPQPTQANSQPISLPGTSSPTSEIPQINIQTTDDAQASSKLQQPTTSSIDSSTKPVTLPTPKILSLGNNLVKNPLSIEGKSQWENLINVQDKFDSTKPNAFCTYQTSQSQGWRGIKSKPIEIQADKNYNFRALLSWKDAVKVHVAIEWQNKSHIQLDRPQKDFGSGNSNGWISEYQTFKSPPNAAFAVLHIWHGMQNNKSVPKSTLCIDEIQFVQS